MKWNIFDRKIELKTYDGYERGPHWSNSYKIEFYFEDQCGKGSFYHEIICSSLEQDESQWIDDERAKLSINDLKQYISLLFDSLSKNETIRINLSNDLYKEIYFCIFEGFKGPTDEERKQYEGHIVEHNKKCEEFRKENPYYWIEELLKPGLSSILGDSVPSPEDWPTG